MSEQQVTQLIEQYGIHLVQDALLVTMELKRDEKRYAVVKALLDGRLDARRSREGQETNP